MEKSKLNLPVGYWHSFLLLLTLLISSCGGTKSAANTEVLANEEKVKSADPYKYLVQKPFYYTDTMNWPVVFFLHGAGERGTDMELLKVHGPPMMVEAGYEFPAIVVSPQCPLDVYWDVDRLNATYEKVMKEFKEDKYQIYLTGLSMGGKGTWDWAIDQPNRFAAIVPICGWKNLDGVEKIAHIPTWVFHGAKDPVITQSHSDEMVAKLMENGAEVQYTVYPDEEHLSWIPAYKDEALWKWLFAQRLR